MRCEGTLCMLSTKMEFKFPMTIAMAMAIDKDICRSWEKEEEKMSKGK